MDFSLKKTLVAMGILGGAALSLRSLAAQPVCFPELQRPKRILLLGDSLTATPGYRETLFSLMRGETLFKAVSIEGAQIAAIRKAGLQEARQGMPFDAVVVLAGVNDLVAGAKADQVCRDLDHTYRSFDELGVKVIAVSLLPWAEHAKGAKLQDETRIVNDYISSHSIPCRAIKIRSLEGQAPDGLHLTRTGGEALAKTVAWGAFGVNSR